MKYASTIILIIFLSSIFGAHTVIASQPATDGSAQVKQEITPRIYSDVRTDKLHTFLQKYNSSLESHADLIVVLADTYNLPWTLVPAISGVESGFCRNIPKVANCWGWNNGSTGFDNLEQAIFIVTRTIRYSYYDHGLDTPQKMNKVYAPPSTTWATKVVFFMQAIENTPLDTTPSIDL